VRWSRLIAKGRALRSSRLLAGGLAAAILGAELVTLSVPLWLSVLGVVLAAAGLAILVAAAGYRGMTDDAGRRLLLAALLFVVMAPVAGFLWFQHPAVEVALRQVVPAPGAALTLSHVSSAESEKAPLLESTFGTLEVADIGPRSDSEGAQATIFHFRLPVARSDCARLEAEFDGGCADPGRVLRDFEGFEIVVSRGSQPLTAVIRPRGARTIELIETTAQAQQRVPTEWNFAHDGPSTDVELHCLDGAPLEVKTPFASAHAHCALDGATFRLSVEAGGRLPATLFLSELSEFKADVTGSTAEAIVEDAELSVDGSAENLPSSPVKISMNASKGESFDLELDQSLASDLNEVAFRSAGVSSVTVGDQERVPNWFEQQPDLAYFVVGILFATLVPALFDFFLARLKRIDSDP
jgi:hypothetical protein